MGAIKLPREALGEWMKVGRLGGGAYQATLEDHFGAAQSADLLARCALAAQDATPGALRALRADWLAPAPPEVPIALSVEAGPSGRAHVNAAHAGTPIGRVLASFAPAASAVGYQDVGLPEGLPAPEGLPTTVESARKEGWPEEYAAGPVEFRRVGPRWPSRAAGESTANVVWLSLRAPLAREPGLELAVLIFLAAFYDHWEFERRIGERFDFERFELRAQSVWIHRALRPEGWLLLRASSSLASDGLALGHRELFTRDGALAVTIASEARVAER